MILKQDLFYYVLLEYSIVQTDVDISHKVWYTQDNAAVSGMRLQIVQLSAKMDSIATKKITVAGGLVFRHLLLCVCFIQRVAHMIAILDSNQRRFPMPLGGSLHYASFGT